MQTCPGRSKGAWPSGLPRDRPWSPQGHGAVTTGASPPNPVKRSQGTEWVPSACLHPSTCQALANSHIHPWSPADPRWRGTVPRCAEGLYRMPPQPSSHRTLDATAPVPVVGALSGLLPSVSPAHAGRLLSLCFLFQPEKNQLPGRRRWMSRHALFADELKSQASINQGSTPSPRPTGSGVSTQQVRGEPGQRTWADC